MTPEEYDTAIRRERFTGRAFVENKAREVRRRIWPKPEGFPGWWWRDPVEQAQDRARDRFEARVAMSVQTPAALGRIIPTSVV